MKKILFFFCLVFLCGITLTAQEYQDCGVFDCPGRCGRFIDQNGDGFCDHGQLSAPVAAPTAKTEAPAPEPVVSPTPTDTKTEVRAVKKTENKVSPAAPDTNSVADSAQVVPTCTTEQQPAANTEASSKKKTKSPYSLILISSITFGFYILTSILVKRNVIKKITHRKIWNFALLITGLVSCLLGFFLVIQINYNIKMEWLWTLKLYHVQFGIAMTIICVFHILWHLNYWKTLFKQKNRSNTSTQKSL